MRARGFLRNLRSLHRRLGLGGIAELVAARALPRALSYRRMALVETPLVGPAHPELEPRRVRAADESVLELHARLAASEEPEVPAFSPEQLDRRFADGYELWLFHIEGKVAHARWLAPPRVRFGDLQVPIEEGDLVTEAAVTLPEFRGHGVSRRAEEHVGEVARSEGATRMLNEMNSFNRRFLASTLAVEGIELLAVVHAVSVAGVPWVRVAPETEAGRLFFERAGLSVARWIRRPALRSRSGLDRVPIA